MSWVYLFAFGASIELGYWPQAYVSDPKSLGLDFWYDLTQYGFVLSMLNFFIWPVLLCLRLSERLPWSRWDLLLACGYVIMLTQQFWSSFRIYEWLLD